MNATTKGILGLSIIALLLFVAVMVLSYGSNSRSTFCATRPPSCNTGQRDIYALAPTPIVGVSRGYDWVAANYGLNMFVEGAQRYFTNDTPKAFPGTKTVAILSGVNAPGAKTQKEKRLQNIAWVVKRAGKGAAADQVWVVFRGTQSDPDMQVNATMLLEPWSAAAPQVLVHKGYNQALAEVKDALYAALQKAITRSDNTIVYVTGLSLGGALSTVAAADLVTRSNLNLRDVRLYAFSPPRVGNQAFVSMMVEANKKPDKTLVDMYSLVNSQDTIPTMPPALLGFAPMPALTFSANWGDGTNNHLAAVQFAHLDRVVQACPTVAPPAPPTT